MKIGLALFIIVFFLAISPMTLLSLWVFTSPIISNFLERSLFYSIFASKRIWDYQTFVIPGFDISELLDYDRMVLTLLFLTVLFSKRYKKLKLSNIDYCFFVLLSILFISSSFSNNPIHSIKVIADSFGLCYMAYFLGKNLIQNTPNFLRFINSVTLLACILIIIGLIEWQFVGPDYKKGEIYRITGPFREWEIMGSVLTATLFILFYKAMTVFRTFRIKRFLLKLLIILNCFCLFLTQTRTTIFAAAVGILISMFKGRNILDKRFVLKIAAFSVLAAAIIAIVPEVVTDTEFYKSTLERETGASRMEGYTAAYRMFIKNPLFGIGFKNFQNEFINYIKEEELVYSEPGKTTLHNSYLAVIAEIGLIGILPLLLLVFYAFKVCNNYYDLEKDKDGKYWGLAVISFSTAYFLSPLTFDLFFLSTIDNKLYYFCLGIISGRYQRLAWNPG